MPSLLHSRGLLAGAGSAASLIAAAFVSLLFATGLVAFRSWPGASGSPVPTVNLPSAPATSGVPTGARGRASDVAAAAAAVLPGTRRPDRGGAGPSIAGTGGGGSAPTSPTGSAAPSTAAGTGGSQQQPVAAPSVTRQLTTGLADTTSATTHQVGDALGGPAGAAVQTTGDHVAQTVRDVGDATAPALGALGG